MMTLGPTRSQVEMTDFDIEWQEKITKVVRRVAKDLIANAIDKARRESLFSSRGAITDLEQWESIVQSRQAIPFLRVFGSDEVLDGTLVHPEDYVLAHKLAKSLEIDLPPGSPRVEAEGK